MKWSWKMARLAGIDVRVHVTFFLLLYLVGISYWNEYGTFAAVVSGVGFVLALFSCVILDEVQDAKSKGSLKGETTRALKGNGKAVLSITYPHIEKL